MRLHARLVAAIVVAVAAVVVLAGCGSGGGMYGGGSQAKSTPAAAGAGGSTAAGAVAIRNFAFAPSTLTIKVGAKVTWTNQDSSPHNVTSTDGPSVNAGTTAMFASANLDQGQSFSFTFTKAGTYYYECTIHRMMQSMHAKIVVK
jgi:plastocyanin